MYLYTIEEPYMRDRILCHEKKFTQEEFTRMCKKAPKQESYRGLKHCASYIEEFLIVNYGFTEPVPVATFDPEEVIFGQ